MIITIDGPGGVGKSTLSKKLAEALNYEVLDTGSMYRAVAYFCKQKKIKAEELEEKKLLSHISITIEKGLCFLNGVNISTDIRTPEMDMATSYISTFPYVRSEMKKLQQKFAQGHNIVAEGRDMGSNVFPQAEIKFYLDASSEVRAKRRSLQLSKQGINEAFEKILQEIIERDKRDSAREISPLMIPDGAYTIDTDILSMEEVFAEMLRICKKTEKETPK